MAAGTLAVIFYRHRRGPTFARSQNDLARPGFCLARTTPDESPKSIALYEVVVLLRRYERSVFGDNRCEGRRRQIGVIVGLKVHVL
jgi:hypothetical protein